MSKPYRYHVFLNGQIWAIRRGFSSRVVEYADSRERAIERGGELSRRHRVPLYIHAEDGTVHSVEDYSNG